MATYAFATSADLAERWRPLEGDEAALADTLLEDAGLMLRQYVSVDGADEQRLDALRMVSCNLVKRAMVASSSSAFGVDQTTANMGPFSQTMHFINPSGDLYISAVEKAMLGIGETQIRSIIPGRIEERYGSDA